MQTYTIRLPFHAAVVAQATGKKNGKVILTILECPKNPHAIGDTLRYTQDWLDSSPSVTQGNNL